MIRSGLILMIKDLAGKGKSAYAIGQEAITLYSVIAPRNSVLAKLSLPVRKSFHGVAVYF